MGIYFIEKEIAMYTSVYTFDVILELAVYSIFIFLVVSVLKFVAKKLVGRFKDEKISYSSYSTVRFGLNVFLVFLFLFLWGPLFRNFMLTLCFGALCLALLGKDVVVNWLCGLYIKNKKIFSIGDRIEIGSTAGEVISLERFGVEALELSKNSLYGQTTGMILYFSNKEILKNPIFNSSRYSRYVWDEIEVPIPLGEDIGQAKRSLYKILNDFDIIKSVPSKMRNDLDALHSSIKLSYNNCEPTIYTHVRDAKVFLTLRYLVQPRKAISVRSMLWSKIVDSYGRGEIVLYKVDD